jgi:hypothetical protein
MLRSLLSSFLIRVAGSMEKVADFDSFGEIGMVIHPIHLAIVAAMPPLRNRLNNLHTLPSSWLR